MAGITGGRIERMAVLQQNEIFGLPVDGRYLVVNPLAGISSLLNNNALKFLKEYLLGTTPLTELPDDLVKLAALLMDKPPPPIDPERLEITPQFLGIIPTRGCNISCRYCDFGSSGGNHQTMSLSLAVAAVNQYVELLLQSNQYHMEVHFFGGEPFIAREVVETVIHRGRALAARHNLTPHFEVSTNGVFEADYARFIGDYFHAVVLSFDGFRDVHDLHRPINNQQGSFDHVCQSARVLSKSPTDLCLRCCVSSANVTQLEDIGDWFCREFQPSTINFETLSINPGTKAAGLAPPDPYLFSKNCYDAQRRIRKHGINPVYASADREVSRPGFCPVGNDALIVSPDGRVSSCYLPRESWLERFLDMDVGRIKQDGKMEINHNDIVRLRNLTQEKPRCRNCFCRATCSGGCHVSHTYPGSAHIYEDYCIQTRLLTTCRLLDEMGQEKVAKDLLDNRESMEALALQVSDRIEDIEI